jgi:hypothetical protein
VARVPKSAEQTFQEGWDKTVAWAQSNGISSDAYLPVYQADLSRLQNGEYPLSAGERNREVLAAHNPTTVTPSPGRSPTNVLHNTLTTAKNLFTGLIKLPEELWHSADATFHAIANPASLNAKSPLGTIGNWLNDTLLAYLPYTADIGTILQHGVKGGLETLAEHPLAAFLDLIPGSEGGILGRLGRAGEISADAADAGRQSLLGKMGSLASSATVGHHPGVTMGGVPVASLSITQRLENTIARLGPGGSGLGPALSRLGAYIQNSSIMGQNLFSWLFDGPGRAYSNLSDAEKNQVRYLLQTKQADGGSRLLSALESPDLSAGVRDTITQFLEGPQRFATEEDIFAGQGLTAIDTPSGKTGFWTGPRLQKIEAARLARERTERLATKEVVNLQHHADNLEQLDARLTQAVGYFQARLGEARQAVAQDAGLLTNVTQELENPTKFRRARGISKSQQVKAVVGEGGLADEFIREVQKAKRNPAQIGVLAEAMKRRLSRWDPKSVNAADNAALAQLAETVDAFSKWADAYRKETKAIDEAIHGEAGAVKHGLAVQDAFAEAKTKALQQRQATERDNLRDTYQQARARHRGQFAHRISQMNDTRTELDESFMRDAESRARHATKAQVDQIWRETSQRLYQLKRDFASQLRSEREAYLGRDKEARLTYQRDQSRMTRTHYTEREALKKERREQRAAHGSLVKELDDWSKAVDGFRKAVADNPADQFRDPMMVLFEKHLLQHLEQAKLVDATRTFVEEETPGKWEELTKDPAVLGEFLVFRFRDIYGEPRLGPEAAADAEDAYRESWESADAELKTLIAQGFDVPYIPTSVSSDVLLGRNAIKPLIGRGIPKTDMSKAKVWDLTPQTGDFALGLSKAVVQALQRDATIDLFEHYLKPMSMSGEDVRAFVAQTRGPGAAGAVGNIALRYQDIARQELGLEAMRPHELFQFSLPRWANQEIWLPKPIVNALKELQRERKVGVLNKVTKVYRYSILGLSPRFDAHILFGGTVMAGFRVSPHAFRFIGDAYRAVRDGTIPEIPGHASIEEGFDDTVIRMWHQQGAEQMLKLEIAEHVEVKQGIKRAAVKPIHLAKAVADINFRFTRYVRSLQVATVYLDGAAQALRKDARIALPAADTGRTVYLSAERAMEQGMRAVEDVYGNLGYMSPLERQVAQSIIPFYSWQKHVLKYVLSFPVDHPWRALVLSQAAIRASESVPASWPIRLQLLFFLGSPSKTGTVTAIDIRSIDPFRTTANYFTLTGWMQSLNPLLVAGPAMLDPEFVYGSNTLYPNLTYTAFYGQEVAGQQGNIVTGLSQIAPQLSAATSALSSISSVRSLWQTDRTAAIKQLLDNLNIPFVTPPVNLKQVAAHGEQARYETAKSAATTAFRSGTFKGIAGYRSVPNPLNPDYTITPAALEALYKLAKQEQPNVAPIESLIPPPTPYGY